MRWYRKFKKKYRTIHVLIVAIAIVMFWRGVWGILDTYLVPHHEFISYGISILVAFVILYVDDFHLKELE